jgi:hypothetical protein
MSEPNEKAQEQIERAQRLAAAIAPMLEGQDPDVLAAMLAQLTVTWISGHYPTALRAEILEAHITALRALVAAQAEHDQPPQDRKH